jgi:hypothetical protein
MALGFAVLYGWIYMRAAAQIGPSLSDVDGPGHGDFGHFYHAARAMRQHADPYAAWKRGYLYPPLLAFIMMPLAELPAESAARLFIAFNVFLSIGLSFLAARETARRLGVHPTAELVAGAALLATLLLVDKIRGEIRMGQTNVIMLASFVLGLVWLDRRPRLSGLALGLGANIKYLPIVLLPYLLVRRRWQAAGAFVGAIVGFAFLPSIWSGRDENLRQLSVTFGGLLKLIGMDTGNLASTNVESIGAPLSVSVTSMFARVVGGGEATALAMSLSLAAVLLTSGAILFLIRRVGLPVLAWPISSEQNRLPYSGMVLFDWVGLMALVLAFSPQTNTRHLYLTLLVVTAAAVVLFSAPGGLTRRPLIIGMIVFTLGVNWPDSWLDQSTRWWSAHGGPTVSLLFMYATLLVVGLSFIRGLTKEKTPNEIGTPQTLVKVGSI